MTWSDGAGAGIGAARALETVLGGKEPPTEADSMTREQMEAHIVAAPWPGGKAPEMEMGADAYDLASRCIAKAFLLLMKEGVTGDLWDEMKAHWPDYEHAVGGASGFMVGWAENAARYVLGQPEKQNPALAEIG